MHVTAAGLAILSCGLMLWQWAVARRFPLHERTSSNRPEAPGVTLLKPLKGCDAATEECLRSWFEQEYPGPVQILFGVASPEDPVVACVKQLCAAHPLVNAELIVCRERLGLNAKVSSLVQMERHALYDILVVSDADVWVPSDLLREITEPLRSPEVSLVNCFYEFARARTMAMKWEAVAVNADFWSQVLQSQSLKPLDFALGAVMAIARPKLKAAGGFDVLLDYLADDYQLGNRLARDGGKIVLSPVVVQCRSGEAGWGEVWSHQLRWARTIRVCQPVPFFFSILSNGTLWPLIWIGVQPSVEASLAGLAMIGVRLATAHSNQTRLTRAAVPLRESWLILVKDLAGLIVWGGALAGNRVQWRGKRYRMLGDGRLAALRETPIAATGQD